MKQKQVAKISVFITSIFILFLSITYAFMDMTLAGLKRQVITAGNYELEIDEDENNLTIQNALPMYDEVGMLQDPFTFRLINKDNKGLEYYLKLVDVTNESKEKLDTNIVKYAFTKNGENTIDYLSHIEDEKIDHDFIAPGKTIEYALRMWIDIDVTDESVIQGKNLSYKIAVDVFEDTRLSGMMKSTEVAFNDYGFASIPSDAKYYWPYANQITSIIFENDIAIPNNINESWDISLKEDESVMAYLESTGNETTKSFDPWTNTVTEKTISGYRLHIQGKIIYANEDSSYMFSFLTNLKTIQNLNFLDTSYVTNMFGMFYGDENLTSLDLSNFNTSNVTNMGRMFSGMFIGCTSLTNLDLSHFDTSKVKNMAGMFSGCKYLTNLNVLSFNTSNVTDMYGMFDGCSLTSLDLRHFNTSRVTDMAYMFFECKNLTNLTISSFDTSNVTNMSSMFSGCAHLSSLNIGNFVTSKVTDMRDMFQNCGVLTSLNFKNSDTSNVTDMSNMFSGCTKLLTLQLGNFIVPEKSSGVLSRPFGYIADIVPSNCKITVKNQASKAQILKTDNRFTNITVTG